MCPIGHWEVTQGTGHFYLEKTSPHAAVDPASLLPPWLSTLPPVTGKCEKHLLRFPNLPPRKAPTPLRTNGINIPLRPHSALCRTPRESTFSGPLYMVSVLKVSTNKHVLSLQSLLLCWSYRRGKICVCPSRDWNALNTGTQLSFLSILSLPSSLSPPSPTHSPFFLHPSPLLLSFHISYFSYFHFSFIGLFSLPFLPFFFPSSATCILNSSLRSSIRLIG